MSPILPPLGEAPLVTVVTPSLNQGDYIERNLTSVRRQTYRNVEHIVVDGGSHDTTLDTLRRHEGAYDLRWISEPDGGMYDAVNKGLRNGRGEIQAYLNTDDEYFPWTVQVAVDAFRRFPECGLVCGDALYIREPSGRGVPRFSPPFDLGMVRRTALLCQPTVFWRREVFEELDGFDATLRFVGDCDFWMRAGALYRVHKVEEILAIDAVRTEALRTRYKGQLMAELEGLRGRYGPREGPVYLVYSLADSWRQLVGMQWRFTMFTGMAIAARLLPAWRHAGRWKHFLSETESVELSLGRLIMGNVPLRNRPLGVGSVSRVDGKARARG
ncbi:MAG: glycosyltransferase family 2 protein [Acidobacteriota bacterium]|jgi:hypothetical protein